MPTARARHIQVGSVEDAKQLLRMLDQGEQFDALASQYSICPSGEQGGNLGQFNPGMLAPEMDDVVFEGQIGVVHGPIESDWGFHLVEILERKD